MSLFSGYATKLAMDLQNSNMQMHMGNFTGYPSQERKHLLDRIIDYTYETFIQEIYDIAIGRRTWDYNEDTLSNYFIENQDDLVPIFSQMNEDCLNDPDFSKAIVNHEQYTKSVGVVNDKILFYLPGRPDSISHKIKMNLLYIPSIDNDEPNKFRLEFTEQLSISDVYPYITFSVDFLDNGKIVINDPIMYEIDEDKVEKRVASMADTHIRISDDLHVIRNGFMTLFEKCGITEDINQKNR